ncbi:MAG: hypothetical protein ACRDUV_09550 [Pseudonocardiaceae bacterium]
MPSTTPHLASAVVAFDAAIAAVKDADITGEAPQPVLGLCVLQAKNIRAILAWYARKETPT